MFFALKKLYLIDVLFKKSSFFVWRESYNIINIPPKTHLKFRMILELTEKYGQKVMMKNFKETKSEAKF